MPVTDQEVVEARQRELAYTSAIWAIDKGSVKASDNPNPVL
jgi:hypothetical protein